jgi:hypothetical protein
MPRVALCGLAEIESNWLPEWLPGGRSISSNYVSEPPRQQSLAAAVEWSYRPLEENEQRAFRAVSVFPGSFTLTDTSQADGRG